MLSQHTKFPIQGSGRQTNFPLHLLRLFPSLTNLIVIAGGAGFHCSKTVYVPFFVTLMTLVGISCSFHVTFFVTLMTFVGTSCSFHVPFFVTFVTFVTSDHLNT